MDPKEQPLWDKTKGEKKVFSRWKGKQENQLETRSYFDSAIFFFLKRAKNDQKSKELYTTVCWVHPTWKWNCKIWHISKFWGMKSSKKQKNEFLVKNCNLVADGGASDDTFRHSTTSVTVNANHRPY